MHSENGLLVDLDDVAKMIDQCDVFAVGFRSFPQRLLVDTRYDREEGPFIGVVEPVASVQERFFWLGQQRPRFGAPQRFTFFVWPHSIAFFQEAGLDGGILRRCHESGGSEVLPMFEAAMADIRERDRLATIGAIKGESYHTLWALRR